jgi:hypothetical protein
MRSADARRLRIVDRAASCYGRRIQEGFNPRRADGDSAGQEANYREALERAELKADQVRQVLMEHGVQTIQFVIYRGFGLHVDRLVRTYSGESLRVQVVDSIQRWACYGCKPDVLTAICLRVFGLVLDCKP